jgi:hypothetical protein
MAIVILLGCFVAAYGPGVYRIYVKGNANDAT